MVLKNDLSMSVSTKIFFYDYNSHIFRTKNLIKKNLLKNVLAHHQKFTNRSSAHTQLTYKLSW